VTESDANDLTSGAWDRRRSPAAWPGSPRLRQERRGRRRGRHPPRTCGSAATRRCGVRPDL
jgi:hypothetical protein